MAEPTHIRVTGARQHNLKNCDVDIPRNALVVFTGVSGSGKSTLAFDTVYQEGQRRFMESLSAYARQFLGSMERPDVEAVEGISPTLSIDQKTVNRNPRSTVGTVTELYDHLRLLMARLGTLHCPVCARSIQRLSIDQLVDAVLEGWSDEKVYVLGCVVNERKGEYRKELEGLRKDGWVRARIDGSLCRLDEAPALARYEKHTIEVVVDRLEVRASDRGRLDEAVRGALEIGQGIFTILSASSEREATMSMERSCPDHPDVALPEVEPRLFSFNAPQGACDTCNGLGYLEGFAVERLFDPQRPIAEAFLAFNDHGRLPFAKFDRDTLMSLVKRLGGSAKGPVSDWPKVARQRLLYGDPGLRYTIEIVRGGKREIRERRWAGLVPMVERVWHFSRLPSLRRFRDRVLCGDCGGERLNPIARAATFRGATLPSMVSATVCDAHQVFRTLDLTDEERPIGAALVSEINNRLAFLEEVGLGYLTLDRPAATLSGGEAQRIRLAAQVGSALQGVTYVLDEPSIGLHQRDNDRLLEALCRLRDRGNSVLVVEHDEQTIRSADWVVDIGPKAGRGGGEVVFSGPPSRLLSSKASLTGAYLRGEKELEDGRSRPLTDAALTIQGARVNNLDAVDVSFPLGVLTVVTGVSGSGKSSLVFDVLEASLRSVRVGGAPVGCDALGGAEHIDKVIRISQQPIGRTPRSNPATYTGLLTVIRELFAATHESQVRGYGKGRFSFNVAGGRCSACEGAGVQTIEMQFLPSVQVTCDVCQGSRFNPETLEVTWAGRNIAEVLAMTISEAHEAFQDIPKAKRVLQTLLDVGLGYVQLGQPSTTLSGGEAQRMKLATELHRPATGKTLYLMDEPTTGLHDDDIGRLLLALQRLVDAGNSVVVIEHHTALISRADHLIDLGPEGGPGGGHLVGEGSPDTVSRLDTPTGRVLAQAMSGALQPVVTAPSNTRRKRGNASALRVQGARKHNLADIDVSIPHGKLTVITGPSGAGKTSLAFDTLFAEGQRQYVSSLSTYARRFLGRAERAPVDSLEGLQPAIAIDARTSRHNPRSTVATVTEIHDVLRLLYSRVGLPHCPTCDAQVLGYSPSVAAQRLKAEADGAGWICTRMSPVAAEFVEARRGGLMRDGWTRLLELAADGTPHEVALSAPEAGGLLEAGAWLVLDRLNPSRAASSRVSEAISQAYTFGQGKVWFRPRTSDVEPLYLTERPSCADHGIIHAGKLTPRHFSFNSYLGACEACDGIGTQRTIATERLVVDASLPFWEALDGRAVSVIKRSRRSVALVNAVMDHWGVDDAVAWADWPKGAVKMIFEGANGRSFEISWRQKWGSSMRHVRESKPWDGLFTLLAAKGRSNEQWLVTRPCSECSGGRLRPELLAVRVHGSSIHDIVSRTVDGALDDVSGWAFEGAHEAIAERPVQELSRRLRFLSDVGLGYLSLARIARSLSGGEAQRIRLASQLGNGLTGTTYVLDEPTVGLHPRDTDRLLTTLEGLRDQGNTVVVVEHDLESIRRADHVIDMGPMAGQGGGQVVAFGTPKQIGRRRGSVTGPWLTGKRRMTPRETRREPRSWIHMAAPTIHNLRMPSVAFPMGVWLGVSGVSGSGKSSLVMDTLVPAVRAEIGGQVQSAPCASVSFGETIDRLVVVDQSPIGGTPRSTPATYCGIFTKIRTLFAKSRGSAERGWKPGMFSFNGKSGRCALCEGRGQTLVEMHFLPDVWVTCDGCRGRRYAREVLEVRWGGHTIADVLQMRASDAHELFANHPSIARSLQALVDVGLGYLRLGQPATTLSGGEAQRVKLASELTSRKGHALYVLDEPTTGLHPSDVEKLVAVLHRLVDAGHTVVTIEHHMELLDQADWLLDLGPEGGSGGGQLLGCGEPEQLRGADTPTGAAI